jgi:hypothetical protein
LFSGLKGTFAMRDCIKFSSCLGILALALLLPCAAQQSLPNPFRLQDDWAHLPAGRTLGAVIGVDVDHSGHVWALERCGGNTCAGSSLAPILEFDKSGNLIKSFGQNMFIFPHGLYVDSEDNVWVTDGLALDGKGGHKVVKFSSDGKVLLTLGKDGVPGNGPDMFNAPSDVVVAKNGDIFVADGHGGDTNARIVKFSKDGRFIKAWGKKGSGPGEFDIPHSIDMDSTGRIFVGDRNNNRIQVFDQDGTFITQWKQFGRPSGVYVDSHDYIYVADAESTPKDNPGFEQGIRVGSTKDGALKAFIPPVELPPGAVYNRPLAPGEKPRTRTACVATDAEGNIYGAESGTRSLRKYIKAGSF